MDVYEAICRRRSVRRFQDRAVPYDILERCVDAGRLAASARNRQLCEYIIVDDEKVLPGVFDSITMWAGKTKARGATFSGAPRAFVVILVNSALEAELGASPGTVSYDVGLAAGTIMLVALEQGVGSCPIRSFDGAGLRRRLGIPDSHEAALVIALGYPAESPVAEVAEGSVAYWVDSEGVRHVPKRKLAAILHRNRF
jgi:nitroreductase